jgi:hypothetical protein
MHEADWIRSGTHPRAALRSLAEPWAATTSPEEQMVLTIFAGIQVNAANAVDRIVSRANYPMPFAPGGHGGEGEVTNVS